MRYEAAPAAVSTQVGVPPPVGCAHTRSAGGGRLPLRIAPAIDAEGAATTGAVAAPVGADAGVTTGATSAGATATGATGATAGVGGAAGAVVGEQAANESAITAGKSSGRGIGALHGGTWATITPPVAAGLHMSNTSISLTRFLIEEQRADRINPDLRLLIEVVARACKTISIAVGKGALGGVLGDVGTGSEASINVQGEAQKKLDVLSNEILMEANAWGGHLAGLASEEMDTSQAIPDKYPRGNYLLLFDPLDGSSNIDVNVSVGTIFSV